MLARGLLAGIVLWTAALVTAPAALASSQPMVGGAAAGVYLAGGLVCHQLPARSFRISGRPMPVCARCTGLYASALAGGIVAFRRRRRGLRLGAARWALAAAALPTAVTWSLEYAGLEPFSNGARAIAALPLGAAAGWIVIALVKADGGQRQR